MIPTPPPLNQQVAAITGASSGIGRATARAMVEAGMRVVLTARREANLASLADELGDAATFLAGDICDPALPRALIDKAVDTFGRCDVAVNNAGMLRTGPIEELDLDEICRMVRVNVEAAYRMAYTTLRHFKQAGFGHLVNISSVLGTKVRPRAGAYAGTKYAIEALSEALRMELAKTPVQVSCIEPGLVYTELHDHMPRHPRHDMEIEQPLMPEDIARLVMFVLTQPAHVRIPRLLALPAENEL